MWLDRIDDRLLPFAHMVLPQMGSGLQRHPVSPHCRAPRATATSISIRFRPHHQHEPRFVNESVCHTEARVVPTARIACPLARAGFEWHALAADGISGSLESPAPDIEANWRTRLIWFTCGISPDTGPTTLVVYLTIGLNLDHSAHRRASDASIKRCPRDQDSDTHAIGEGRRCPLQRTRKGRAPGDQS
jgi:hypothetical protein